MIDSAELAAIARHPRADWRRLVEQRTTEAAVIDQAMLWLATELVDDPEPPSLGAAGARYQLVGALDRGATATIWEARDRLLDRTVAIKLFHDDATTTSRALREARAASDVISDHVVRVLDVVDGEHALIVMELVGEYDARGELHPGRAASEDRPRSLAEAIRWVIQVARGVHDAHLRNVFHRDLNPRNVLIAPLSRRARIADFGLAASRHGDHRFGGTPAYMAPELVRGFATRPTDPAARARLVAIDIWGLGAIAYDLLAGRAPWPVDRPWDASPDDRPPPLDHAVTGERIPATLRRIVERMLASAPADRYGSAREVADELAAFAAARPTSFDRGSSARAWLWCRRNPQVATTGVVALGLAALVAGSLVSLSRLRDEHEVVTGELAERQAERARLIAGVERTRDELREAEQQVAAKTTELAAVGDSLRHEREAYVEVLAAKERALQQASAERHLLLDRLEDLQDDRSVAVSTGRLYERFWLSARRDADRATTARARIETERDLARAEVRALHARLADLERSLAASTPDHAGRPAEPSLKPEPAARGARSAPVRTRPSKPPIGELVPPAPEPARVPEPEPPAAAEPPAEPVIVVPPPANVSAEPPPADHASVEPRHVD